MDPEVSMNGSVLLIDNDPGLHVVVGDFVRARGYTLLEADDAAQGLQHLRASRPAAVFLDAALPPDEAAEILVALSKEAPDTPVVVLAPGGDTPVRIGRMDLDAFQVLPRPVTRSWVDHALRHAEFNSRLMEAARAHLRYLERRNIQLDVRLHELEKLGLDLQRENRQRARTEEVILRQMRGQEETEKRLKTIEAAFDGAGDALLITDAAGAMIYANAAFERLFGSHNGSAASYDLRRLFVNPTVATTMKDNVASLGTFSCEVEMNSAAGTAFPALVRASTIAHAASSQGGRLFIFTDVTEQEQLRRQAYHDALTGLYSRRHLMDQLRQSMSLARRHSHPLSLCICDLDKFKLINDTHGHIMGDQVLEIFARIIRDEIRAEDIAGRLGGDEFCIIFPHARADFAALCLERIRKKFGAIRFTPESGETFNASATFGIADMQPADIPQEGLIELADQSLYAAKELGRNCVTANGKNWSR
jgi:diguanylate cyclase (GGDEF)-like protein/PAS domain S-box-containing protein